MIQGLAFMSTHWRAVEYQAWKAYAKDPAYRDQYFRIIKAGIALDEMITILRREHAAG